MTQQKKRISARRAVSNYTIHKRLQCQDVVEKNDFLKLLSYGAMGEIWYLLAFN